MRHVSLQIIRVENGFVVRILPKDHNMNSFQEVGKNEYVASDEIDLKNVIAKILQPLVDIRVQGNF